MAEVKGLKRLERQLAALPNSVRVAVADALEKQAAELAEAIRRAVPVDTGDLRQSVGWTQGLPTHIGMKNTGAMRLTVKDLGGRGQALNAAGLLYTVYAGDDEAFYARFVEFGTAGGVKRSVTLLPGGRKLFSGTRTPSKGEKQHKEGRLSYRTHPGTQAQPFFYPTVRARKKQMKAAVARAGRKAAKDIAAL